MLAHTDRKIAIYQPSMDYVVVLEFDGRGYYEDMFYFYFDMVRPVEFVDLAYLAKGQFMAHGPLSVWDYHQNEVIRDATFSDLVTYCKGMRYQQFAYGEGVVSGDKFGHDGKIYIA